MTTHTLALMRMTCGALLCLFLLQNPIDNTWLSTSLTGFAVAFTLGVIPRLTGPVTLGLYALYWLDLPFAWHHHSAYFLGALTVLAFSPSSQHYSAAAWLWNFNATPTLLSKRWLRAARTLVPAAYALTFAAHCKGATATPKLLVPIALVSIALCLGLWWTRTRRATLVVGLIYHLALHWALPIDIGLYTPLVLSFYLAYLTPSIGHTVVLYDGSCTFCERARRLTMVCDWLQRLSWVNFRDPIMKAQIHCASDAQLEEEMVAITKDGVCHGGFHAWRVILEHLPIACTWAWLLRLPGLRQLGEACYAVIARNRFGLAPCTSAQCRIPGTPPEDTTAWRATLNAANTRSRNDV